jgi:hypothetical protein
MMKSQAPRIRYPQSGGQDLSVDLLRPISIGLPAFFENGLLYQPFGYL